MTPAQNQTRAVGKFDRYFLHAENSKCQRSDTGCNHKPWNRDQRPGTTQFYVQYWFDPVVAELGGASGVYMVITTIKKIIDGLLAPTCNSVAEVGIFRIMKGLVTPSLHFSHASTMCSMILTHKSAFSFVLDDSFVRTKDSPKDPIHTSKDTMIRIFVLPSFLRYFISPPKIGRVSPGQPW
jgi:hypothetical protein